MPSSRDSNSLDRSPGFPRPVIQKQQATASVNALDGVMNDIGDGRVTERAQRIRVTTDEEMVWQAQPSLLLLIPRVIKYAIIMALIVYACSYIQRLEQRAEERVTSLHGSLPSRVQQLATGRKLGNHSSRSKPVPPAPDAPGAASAHEGISDPVTAQVDSTIERFNRYLRRFQYAVGALLLILLGGYWIQLRTTRYQASSQRLTIEAGFPRSCNIPFELHELGDAIIIRPLLLRLFGIAHLRVARRVLPAAFAYPVPAGRAVLPAQTVVTRSGIATRPYIDLRGLRNVHLVRDLLRQGGQIEAQRADKFRFR